MNNRKGLKYMTIDLRQMRKRLREKQAELLGDLHEMAEERPTPGGPAEIDAHDFADTGTDAQEDEREQYLDANSRSLLTEVRAALKRIDDGTYGLCVVDGEPIPEKRLEAIPWAARCLKHEAELERQNLGEGGM